MIVVDASMAITWLFEDETTADARAILLRVVRDGGVVPSLWRLEIANTLRLAVRRNRCEEGFLRQAVAYLEQLPITDDADTGRFAWSVTLELARVEGLTAYDAAYLELALRRNLPLATGDKALIAAGRRNALEVYTP